MRIIGLDTETTGLNADKGDRIVEIAMITVEPVQKDGRLVLRVIDRYTQRINPQRAIGEKAQAVHGISIEDLVGMPTFDAVVDEIRKRLEDATHVVAHNMDFDASFLGAEFDRVGVSIPPIEAFCTMTNGRWATSSGKNPTLKELCFATGVEYDGEKAHAADYDVQVMLAALARGMDRGFFKLQGVI